MSVRTEQCTDGIIKLEEIKKEQQWDEQ